MLVWRFYLVSLTVLAGVRFMAGLCAVLKFFFFFVGVYKKKRNLFREWYEGNDVVIRYEIRLTKPTFKFLYISPP